MQFKGLYTSITAACLLASAGMNTAIGQEAKKPKPKPEFPPFQQVIEGYEKVPLVSKDPTSKKSSLYTIYVRKKDGQMLAELPSSFASKKYFIALTIAAGSRYAGLQFGDEYVYWRRFGKRLALIRPNIAYRSTGDEPSKRSIKRLFTDQVLLDIPILTMSPKGGPVIDMDFLLVNQSPQFFGYAVRGLNPRLAAIKTVLPFEKNVELAYEVPLAGGVLQTLHYSFSEIPASTGYKPRAADQRVGYFTTSYNDLGKFNSDDNWVRYINRWHLQKQDPSLAVSPPLKPIVFYIEHTTPVRYRRWVREGILYWNKAFEKVGISNAIEVYYQNAKTGDHMEKHPEDVKYNFVRWLSNDISTAIGPSRVHPLTGQILDADIILTDGWIRAFKRWREREVLPATAMEGFGPEVLGWLARHPSWDPRVRLASPSQREKVMKELTLARQTKQTNDSITSTTLLGDEKYDGLIGQGSQMNGMCLAAEGKKLDLSLMSMAWELASLATEADEENGEGDEEEDEEEDKKDEEDKKSDDEKEPSEKKKEAAKKKEEPSKKKESMIDGMPEEFIGTLLADLVAHEVGHTLGLRHNFKASSIYDLEEINSEKVKGDKPFAASVMDYLPLNVNFESGEVQGDYAMIGIGPYDYWAIEYGYTFDKNLKPILARVADPELPFATDEDTYGPDPLARRYDFGKDPLKYGKLQMRLANKLRSIIVEKYVKDGDSWAKARQGYETTISAQARALSMMSNWLGGAFVYRDKKGDGERDPIEVVSVDKQRDALQFVLKNAFDEAAYGLTPDLLEKMSMDKWLDGSSYYFYEDATWPIHDRIMGIQASVLTMLMNPTTLRRVYDNEFRAAADQDMITLPELLDSITQKVWSELDAPPEKTCSARKPWISSLRRNLQHEHLQRLVDLTLPSSGFTAAYKPISNLATQSLRDLAEKIAEVEGNKNLDPYTRAHLGETRLRIEKALDAEYIYNTDDISSGGGGLLFFFGNEANQPPIPATN